MRRFTNKPWTALAAVLMLCEGGAFAATVTWTNTTSGGSAWETTGNWNGGALPGPADTAKIANGGKAIVNSTFSITNLTLQSQSTLRIESGAIRITDPAANDIKFADSGGTSSVEQVGGTLELTGAQAAYWGYNSGNAFYGRFSGGSMICTNPTGSAWLGIGNYDAKFDIEVSSSAVWNVYALRMGYGAGTASPKIFRQKDSSTVTGTTMVVGYSGCGTTYYMDNGTNSHGTLDIWGSPATPATMIINGGIVRATGGANDLLLGNSSGSQGFLIVSNGTLTVVGNTIVGYYGQGILNVYGGTVTLPGLLLAWNTGTGTVTVANGAAINLGGQNFKNQINVGYLNLGDATSSGSVTNIGTVTVGENSNPGQIYIRGWGVLATSSGFNLIGTNTMQVTADGYNAADRTLSITGSAAVAHVALAASSGWYARNRGKLLFPSLAVSSGNVTNNWADRSTDLTNDLVNSVQFIFTNATAGTLNGALLATNRTDVHAGLYRPVGVWEFSGPAFTSATLQFRYDAAAAAASSVAETDLKVMNWSGSDWRDITASVNTNAKCIRSKAIASLGAPSQFAVAPLSLVKRGTIFMLR